MKGRRTPPRLSLILFLGPPPLTGDNSPVWTMEVPSTHILPIPLLGDKSGESLISIDRIVGE